MRLKMNMLLIVALNAVGVGVYLAISSRTWLEPELRGESVATGGDAVVWFFTALPVAVAFLVFDSILLVTASVSYFKNEKRRFNAVALLVPTLWVLGYFVDRAHH